MSSIGKIFRGILIVVVVVIAMAGACTCRGYNQATHLDESVKNAWAQVDNQLQRRFDLIPNIESTIKGLTLQEKDIFLGVAKSREAYFQAKDVGERAKAASGFDSALSRLLVLQEKYPDLRSDQSFMNLQTVLEGTENRLAVERKNYNDAVNLLNTFSRTLLGQFYTRLAGVTKAEYYAVPESSKAVPKVNFGSNNG